jgi:hypothetical protein
MGLFGAAILATRGNSIQRLSIANSSNPIPPLFLVIVPVNIYLAGAIENRIAVHLSKIVPAPFNKGFRFSHGPW